MKRKVKVCVLVDEDVWIEFKKYVLSKHRKLYGYVGYELSEAIKRYLENFSDSKVEKMNPRPKHFKLLVWLAERDKVTHSELKEFININFGVDPRTERKYFNYLTEFGYLIPSEAEHGDEQIFKVNSEAVKKFLEKLNSK